MLFIKFLQYTDSNCLCFCYLFHHLFYAFQVSPVHENLLIAGRPWWEMYRGMSYQIISRSGVDETFRGIISRYNRVEIR